MTLFEIPFAILIGLGLFGLLFTIISDVYGENAAVGFAVGTPLALLLAGWWNLIDSGNLWLQILGWLIAAVVGTIAGAAGVGWLLAENERAKDQG